MVLIFLQAVQVGQPIEPREDLVEGVDGALAYGLAGGLQLSPGSSREALDTHRDEHVVRDA